MAFDSTFITDFKGDSATIKLTVKDSSTGEVVSIPSWPIVCEIWDDSGNSIRKATSNISGGADSQITRTDEAKGELEIYIDKGETTSFNNATYIEVAMLLGLAKDTIYRGEIKLKKPRITWETIP